LELLFIRSFFILWTRLIATIKLHLRGTACTERNEVFIIHFIFEQLRRSLRRAKGRTLVFL